MAEMMLDQLRSLPGPVRADHLRILDTVVSVLPQRWTRRGGVPLMWVTVHDAGEVRVTPTDFGELTAHGPVDDFPRWVGAPVRGRLADSRCAALVYGDRVMARTWGLLSLGARWYAPDTAAVLRVAHRDARQDGRYALTFAVEGRLIKRIRFLPDVARQLDHARQL